MGFNALELLPVHEFNEVESYAPPGPDGGEGGEASGARCNFWGYSTVAFNAPMARYAAAPPGEACAREVKALVRACHAAGVEVILDVVFNHTAEGSEAGPTVSMRGLDNRVYYMTAPEGQCYNYSGCGNTLQCNHPVVRRFVLECLRRWAIEYRIDGFRFDLASILTRASSSWEAGAMFGGERGADPPDAQLVRGTPLDQPPLIDLISNDGVLRVRAPRARRARVRAAAGSPLAPHRARSSSPRHGTRAASTRWAVFPTGACGRSGTANSETPRGSSSRARMVRSRLLLLRSTARG